MLNCVTESSHSERNILYTVVSLLSTKKIFKYHHDEVSEASTDDRRVHRTIIFANFRICKYVHLCFTHKGVYFAKYK